MCELLISNNILYCNNVNERKSNKYKLGNSLWEAVQN